MKNSAQKDIIHMMMDYSTVHVVEKHQRNKHWDYTKSLRYFY